MKFIFSVIYEVVVVRSKERVECCEFVACPVYGKEIKGGYGWHHQIVQLYLVVALISRVRCEDVFYIDGWIE